MNPLQRFKIAIGLPKDFGPSHPYVRFVYVDEGGQVGSDADVEYREGDAGSLVVVTISEWQIQKGQTERAPHMAVTFSYTDGAIVGSSLDDAFDQLVNAMWDMRAVADDGKGASA